jgi:hypothetical protein
LHSAASRAKTKWNSEHYKQMKFSVDPFVAASFKTACERAGLSMAGVVSEFMAAYGAAAKNAKPAGADAVSDRGKRRKLVSALIRQMGQIRDAEEAYLSNIPENLQGSSRHEAAEHSISTMDEAIILLEDIY